MCGIAGAVSLDLRTPADAAAVARMAAALRHRGPDDEGLLADGPVALGHTRLSILDTSAAGHQPMLSADGAHAIVLNGEIYNYKDLRRELASRGHVFRTGTDTEVALAAYREHGIEFLRRLDGMFALALWDRRAERAIVARDPVGIKPLYVRTAGGALWFASELRALLAAPGASCALDPASVAHYFARQYVGGEASIVKDVARLAPGTALVVTASGVRRETFWRYPGDAGCEASERPLGGARESRRDGAPRAAHPDDLLALLSDAVRAHLQSDVPVGVFLSGGIDSSLVAALIARHAAAPMPAYTVAVAGARGVDETLEARRVAEACGLEHHPLLVGAREALAALPALAAALDEPIGDYALLPTHLLAREARRRVTVVLTGEGADELFGGYPRYAHFVRCAWRARVPLAGAPWQRECGDYAATRVFERRELARLLAPIAAELPRDAPPRVDLLARAHGARGGDLVNRMLAVDFAGWLPDDLLAKVDRATMLASLEARVPYLDRRVVEWVAARPGREKIAGRALKRMLRAAAAGVVPAATIARPKHGFTVPVGAWLRGELRALLGDTLGSAACRARGVAEPRVVARLLDGLDAHGRNGLRLWCLLVFELWCRSALDAAPASPTRPPAAAQDPEPRRASQA
jgi:asparagine synthase (glutamine-hydrolysing)